MKTKSTEQLENTFKTALSAMQFKAHQNAIDKGFWPEFEGVDLLDRDEMKDARQLINIGEKLALIHSEVSEALEAARKPTAERDKHCYDFSNFAIELADTAIRLMDLSEACGIPLGEAILAKMDFNKTRPKKHGKVF